MPRICVSLAVAWIVLCAAPLQAQPTSLPSLSPAAMEEFLRNAELSDIRDVGDGVTGSRRAVVVCH